MLSKYRRSYRFLISTLLICLFLSFVWLNASYNKAIVPIAKASIVLNKVMDKLDKFAEDGSFSVFNDIESNRTERIVGLEHIVVGDADLGVYYSRINRWHNRTTIVVDGKRRYNYWTGMSCFITAQLIENYLNNAGIDTSLMLIRQQKFKPLIFKFCPPFGCSRCDSWEYHIVNIVKDDLNNKYVLAPGYSRSPVLLSDYIKVFVDYKNLRLDNFSNSTVKSCLDKFIQPVTVFSIKKEKQIKLRMP